MEIGSPLVKKIALAALCLITAVALIFLILKKSAPISPSTPTVTQKIDTQGTTVKNPEDGQAPTAEEFLSDVTVEKPETVPTTEKKPVAQPKDQTKEEMRAPTITSIPGGRFGNGDTVTIYGTNFTADNTVLLSIEFDDAFMHIPAKNNGTSITFTANLSLSEAMGRDLKQLSPEKHKQVVQHIIDVNSSDPSGWYIDARVAVSNEYGSSAAFPVKINVTKGI